MSRERCLSVSEKKLAANLDPQLWVPYIPTKVSSSLHVKRTLTYELKSQSNEGFMGTLSYFEVTAGRWLKEVKLNRMIGI